MSHVTNYSGFSPASRRGRRTTPLIAAVSLILLAVTASSFAQEAQTTLAPRPKAGISSDFQRMLEGLRRAKPMPDPEHGLRSKTATPSGDLLRFDARTGLSFKVAPGKLQAAPLGVQREGGHAGAVPRSADGVGQTTTLPEGPQAIADAISSADGVTPFEVTPTPPSILRVPYFAPFNQEFQLLMRFPVPAFGDMFYLCSASAISDFHLLSAGHCVYNHDPLGDGSGLGAGFAAEIWAWPAQTDVVNPSYDPGFPNVWTDFPYGVAKMTFQTTYNAWINNSDFNWDMSFITMDRRIGDHTGWPAREWGVEATGLLFTGYPHEAPYVPEDNPFQYIGFDDNNVIGYTCCRIFMDAFTYGGHSGGSVYHLTNSQFTIQGVNSTSNRVGYAEATRFTANNNADLVNTIINDQSVRPPVDKAQMIEYVFNDASKGLVDTSVAIGSSFNFTLNGFNAGYTPAGTVTADVYLTKFPSEHDFAQGHFVKTLILGTLDAFQFTVTTQAVKVPTFIQPGLYYVGWILNATNPQYDTDDHSAIITKGLLTVVGLNAVLTNPNTVVGGSTSTGTVQLTGAAPNGGMAILLTSSNPAVQVSNIVNVPAGASSATFTITTSSVTANTFSTITAASSSAPTLITSTSIQVKPASLNTVTLAPSSIVGGKTSTATVTLNGPAPAGGINVTLSSSSASAHVPASVHINAGVKSATFPINTVVVASATTATIKATYLGVSKTATLSVQPAALMTLGVAPSSLIGGKASTGTVTLNGAAPAGGINIPLSSSRASAHVPTTAHINAGAVSGTFSITTSAVSAVTAATLKATYLGVSKTATLNVQPADLMALGVAPNSLIGGKASTGTVTLNGAAPAGGINIPLSSSSASALVPTTAHINAGAISGTFSITTSAVSAVTAATIKATLSGVSKTATLTIDPPVLPTAVTLSLTRVLGSTNTTATVKINEAAPAGGVDIALSSSNAHAQVPATVHVNAGSSSASFTVTTTAVTATTTATIKATSSGVSKSANLTIVNAL